MIVNRARPAEKKQYNFQAFAAQMYPGLRLFSDPDDRDPRIRDIQVRVRKCPDIFPHAGCLVLEQSVLLAGNDCKEFSSLPERPVADSLFRGTTPSFAPVSMDDLEDAKVRGIADLLPCIQELLLYVIGMPGRMGNIDGEHGGRHQNFTRLSRSEFDTTDTELKAIAAAANIGFSSPSAASGIPMTL